MNKSKEVLSLQQFPALNGKNAKPVNNLAHGETLSFSDLTKVSVPAGGALNWTLESVEGSQTLDVLEGIVMFQALPRFLFATPFEESGGTEPAACISTNSIHGKSNQAIVLPEYLAKIGKPSGDCKTCVFANYGTKPKGNGNNGRGQACQQRRFLLMLIPGAQIPYLVNIPPSGLKSAKKYLVGLQAMGLEYWQVLTSIRLEPDKNQDGIKYAKARFTMLDKLPPVFMKPLEKYRLDFEQQLPMANITVNYPALPSPVSVA